jgi:CRP-like cAMP-binding protein
MSLKGIFPIDRWDLGSSMVLSDLPIEDHDLLMAHARENIFRKGETIFREGGTPVGIFYIRSGKAKKYKVDNTGREHIFYVANSGELLGYHAVLASERYSDSAVALEDTVLVFIPSEDFLSALDRSKVLSRRLLKTLSREFSVLTNNTAVFAQRPVRERVAIALIILREKFKKDTEPEMPVTITISRDDIANMAGTTRENVARFISEFKNDGIISTQGRRIVIVDVKALVAVSNYE